MALATEAQLKELGLDGEFSSALRGAWSRGLCAYACPMILWRFLTCSPSHHSCRPLLDVGSS